MKRTCLITFVFTALAVAVGFQWKEPLAELRKHGSLSTGSIWLDGYVHGIVFTAQSESAEQFVEAMEVLRRCPSVNFVLVPKIKNLRTALLEVAGIEHVSAIELRHTDADEEDLSALAGMRNLRYLDLSHNPTVTDATVAVLSGLESLRYLDLTNTKVTGTGLKHRADMVSLYQLTLTDCPVTDESLAVIPRFSKLEELLIGGTNVTDKGLMNLVGWHSLRRVTRTALTTKAGSRAFNDAFLVARRKAREAGEPVGERDIPPVLIDNTFWRE